MIDNGQRILNTDHRDIRGNMEIHDSTLPWKIIHYMPESFIMKEQILMHYDIEFVYVMKGQLELEINGVKQYLSEKQFAVVNSLDLHSYSYNSADFYRITVSCRYLRDRIREFDTYRVSKKCETDQVVKGMIEQFLTMHHKEEYSCLVLQMFFDMMIHYICEKYLYKDEDGNRHTADSRLTISVIRYLHLHVSEPFDSEHIADTMHLSYEHIARIFRKSTGYTIKQYLYDIRIQQSLSMLKQGGITIQEISDSLGFPNIRSFENAFRNRMHMTPNAYQKMTITNQ
ncbi:MAG: helix-turn-helix transcriptional regulator [Bulleidia sp.]